MILREGKFAQTILIVNKLDGKVYHQQTPILLAPWYALGYEHVLPASAVQQEGISEIQQLLYTLLKRIATSASAQDKRQDPIHLAIIGRPNAGKSTLLNKLTGEAISFVSETPGTTLDYLTAEFQRK